ncbi:hypothetical protein HRI_003808200 [Hibiscus trionum]|uniref:DUF7722 domain-containing protein n=1 Tax=Hibiscus trionum TaxID=183268 RepID=A0A9W7MIT9_HIBTR|nr:hypothetical protein HRI_003808200 [Hibiscus trionum]
MGMEPLEPVAKLSPTSTLSSEPNGDQKAASTPIRTWCGYFQMPLHYPRYTKADYEAMSEWKLDCLLKEYGLPISGDVEQKRNFAMGAFLWHC